jgi:hypothetical protein
MSGHLCFMNLQALSMKILCPDLLCHDGKLLVLVNTLQQLGKSSTRINITNDYTYLSVSYSRYLIAAFLRPALTIRSFAAVNVP